jgi:hypothetical protein
VIKRVLLFSFGFLPAFGWALTPPGDPQIYDVLGNHKGQFLMLSNWTERKRFAEYQDYRKLTGKYFSENQRVWIWCKGKSKPNLIKRITHQELDAMGMTAVDLAVDPGCSEKPLLISNYEFPVQRWSTRKIVDKEREALRMKLNAKSAPKTIKIVSEKQGTFYLVHDPQIAAVYNTGGYRLYDSRLNEISKFAGAPLTPLIDLDGDTVPEFFFPSSDGFGAWLVRMFPRLDSSMARK